MASHQTTSSYLRNSVFDAALEIGLVDPSLSNWLDDVPEVAEEKTSNPTQFSAPSSSAGHEPWISSPDSELSHSSTANTLTTITSNSSQGSFQYASSRHADSTPRVPTPRAVLPDKLELKGNSNTSGAVSGTVLHSSPFVLPLQPQKRAPTKLLKKGRGSDKKGAREKDLGNSNNSVDEAAPPAPYSFLQREPTPPPSDQDRAESKGFFGRLRDRSRSKSRAARKARPSEEVEERPSRDVDAAGGDVRRRGRDEQRKDVQRPGGVTVVKVNDSLPQLQLDPLSNRKSADLLSALSAEFSLVQASATESAATKNAIAAYYAGVTNPSKPVDQPTATTTMESDAAAEVSSSQPIPRFKSVMDRPHPKVRTSGFFATKDRGVMMPASHMNRRVGRKASASRKGSLRGTATGVRRVPSHRRKGSGLGGGNGKAAAGGGGHGRDLSIGGLIEAIREEGARGAETTDFEVDSDSDDDGADRPSSLPYGPQPTKQQRGNTTSASDSEPVPAIPVIIERRPSTKSTRSSKPALSLALDNLAPAVPGTTPIQRLSPSSPMRSPGLRFRRSSNGATLPSPLKPPPTSPLPPTPNGSAPVPEVERPQSGIVTPTAAKIVLASMPSPRQSDWFEDEDSDVDQGRRTPLSQIPSRAASPSEEWIVPTPTSNVTMFQPPPPPSDFNRPIPRPPVAGRAPATAEARARVTASAAMSKTGSSLGVPMPNGMPSSPRPSTSPQPTSGRATPNHMRARPGGGSESMKGPTAPPPSTWNPPTSALTRISSLRSQRGREPNRAAPQQPQPQPQARSHSRDDSNGSNASSTQRGRMSPFPVRPSGSRDVSPLPSLKRTPSKMSTRQKTERVRSFQAEVGGDFDAEVYGRQSGESLRSGESEGWATASTGSSNESGRQVAGGLARPRNYNDVPRDVYMPSPSPMAPRRPGMHSRGPSPLPPPSATLPLNPSPHRPGSRMASPNPMVGRPQQPTLRPSASFTINRPQQMSASNLAPSSSLRIDRNSRVSTRSFYSTGGDYSDDDTKSFRGLDLDDERDAGRGFDVIASKLGRSESKSARLLQRLAAEDAEETLPPKGRGRGSGITRPAAPSLLTVPQRPMTGPNSPNLSPRSRNTPTSAGGARWI